MKKIILPVLMVVLLTGLTKADYKKGFQYLKKGDYKSANAEFQMDIEAYRTYWYLPAYYSAFCFFKEKDFGAALEMLRTAEEGAAKSENKAQEMAKIKILETQILIEQKKFKSAVSLATKYIPQSPADEQGELYYWRGYTYNNMKNFSKAINDFKQALGLFQGKGSKVPLAYYQLGYAYANNNSFQSAIKPLENALKRKKNIKPAYYLLTDIYLNVGRTQKNNNEKRSKYLKAAEWAQKGLNVYKNDKKLMLNLGNANLGAKQYDNAISVFEKMMNKYPSDKDILFGLGSAFMGKKDFRNAEKYLVKVQPKMKSNPLIYTYIASAYLSISKEYTKDVDKKAWVNKAINTINNGLRFCKNKNTLNNKKQEAQKMLASISQNLDTINANIKAMKDNLYKLQDRVVLLKERIRKGEEIKRKTGHAPKSFESDKKELEVTQNKIKTVKSEINKLQKEAK